MFFFRLSIQSVPLMKNGVSLQTVPLMKNGESLQTVPLMKNGVSNAKDAFIDG